MGDSAITIKGIQDRLLVTVGDGPWEAVEAALLEAIQSRGDFFRGAQIALQVGNRTLDRDDIRKLRDKLAEHDVTLRAVLGQSPQTARDARRLELGTELEDVQPVATHEPAELPPISPDEQGDSAVLIKHTLRNGRVVRHTGHVIVIGDVNPGAQIIAGGHILVWGRLRGTVHAGALGDESATICALDMRPMQLRIANHVAIAPDSSQPRSHPETAFVREGQIVAEEWG